MSVHGLYVIYSEVNIDELRRFLLSFTGNSEDIGLMRLDHARTENLLHKETNRTLVTMVPNLFSLLLEEGYGKKNEMYDFKIKEYELKENNFPPSDCTYTLYIKMPEFILLEEAQR